VNGVLTATSTLPLSEDRGPITPDDPAHPRIVANTSENGHGHGFQHTFSLPSLAAGSYRIDLLATALGLIKGDWQIASPMNFERKGIWEGVLWNGKPAQNWTMRPGLVGEEHELPANRDWTAWRSTNDVRPLRWYKANLQVPSNLLNSGEVFRLDATGLGKGMIWVNGKSIGRHWLIEARASAWSPQTKTPSGALSQRYYHIPADWLQQLNEIVILEEQPAVPTNVMVQVRS